MRCSDRVDVPEAFAAVVPRPLSVVDLALRTGDEVPPHQHRRLERHAADEQRPRLLPNVEHQLVATEAEIGELPGLDHGAADRDLAIQHDEPVFEGGVRRERRGSRPQLQVDSDVVGVPARR